MPVPDIVLDLIDRFERNYAAYKSGAYNETQVRREFIDLFFEALGRDVNNTQGYPPPAPHLVNHPHTVPFRSSFATLHTMTA